MVCVVSRDEALGDEGLLEAAQECNGIVAADDLTLQQTADFVGHLMSMPDSSTSAAASLNETEHKSSDAETEAQAARRELLTEYLYKMTGGNPNLIQGMFEALETNKVIHTLPDATKCVDSAYKSCSEFLVGVLRTHLLDQGFE